MLKDDELKKLRDLLAEQYEWPHSYLFKFVVPNEKVEEVRALFPGGDIQERESKTGKYVSVTVEMVLESADVVVAVYQQASKIEGLMSL